MKTKTKTIYTLTLTEDEARLIKGCLRLIDMPGQWLDIANTIYEGIPIDWLVLPERNELSSKHAKTLKDPPQ